MKSTKRKPAKKRKSRKKTVSKRTDRRSRRIKRRTSKRTRLPRPISVLFTRRGASVQKRVFRALARMRNEGESASKAAHHEGLKLDTFVRHARPALRRSAPGKPWRAIPEDQLPAAMKVLTKFGYTAEIIRSSRERRLLGAYSRAIRMFRGGEDNTDLALKAFRGKTVAGHTLITDIKTLIRLEEAGKLDFDDLYSAFGDES